MTANIFGVVHNVCLSFHSQLRYQCKKSTYLLNLLMIFHGSFSMAT